MQSIDIKDLAYDKRAQILHGEASDFRGRLDLDRLTSHRDDLEIVGHREVRRYAFDRVHREGARHEIGDIHYWDFRHVDAFGRDAGGPRVRIFND